MLKNIPPLTKALMIALAACFMLQLVFPRGFSLLLPLVGGAVYPGFQLWRLFTFPFYTFGIFSAISSIALIYFFGSELETIVHTNRLTIWLFSSILSFAILFTILFPNGAVAGPDSIYLFIIGGFTYLWPKREISIFGLFWMKTWILALIIFLFSVLPMDSIHMDLSPERLLSPFFSVISAAIIFHVAFRQYRFAGGFLNTISRVLPQRSQRIRGRDADWNDRLTVEHRIDAILDKISRKGMESLTKEERDFLLQHSK